MNGRFRLTIFLILLGSSPPPSFGDDPAVSIADLSSYLTAIRARTASDPITPVTFRELWDHPENYQGRPVEVKGRLARLFRQPAVGQFPAMAEGWITSPLGEPTCVVFPTGTGSELPRTGDPVRFVGTFLRRITYPGGDTNRVAPLVVGPNLPIAAGKSEPGNLSLGPLFAGDHAADWAIGIVVSLGVLGVLLRRHLDQPENPPALIGPPPTFCDSDQGDPDSPFELPGIGADHDDL